MINHFDLLAESLKENGNYTGSGLLYTSMGDHSMAINFQKKAIEIAESALDPKNEDLSVFYNSIGVSYRLNKQYTLSVKYHLQALSILESIYKPDNLECASTYAALAKTLADRGSFPKAFS